MTVTAPQPGSVTMFTTTWCGYCRNLKKQMTSAGIAFTEIDIEQTPDAARLVAEVNDGNEVVPTVLFTDGTTATNPSLSEVRKRLEA
ncbi:mycoredoxin [Georgenia sp. Z1344]|uniref:mycoredoxin n=1 Tax=Georgenia sp. Z1344 TaxID=3416706 RepID=UPI003CE8E7C5